MFYKEAKSELFFFLLLFIFFFWGGGGGGGGGREAGGAGVRGFFFSQRIQIQKRPILDIELAIDHPPPRGSFVHYDFLKLHYI